MRVLVISHLYPTQTDPVAGRFVFDQVEQLAARGVEVQVISPRPWGPRWLIPRGTSWSRRHRDLVALPGQVPVSYVRFLRHRWVPRWAPTMLRLALLPRVRALHRQRPFDLIHAHTAFPDGRAALDLAHRLGLPLVITVHGADLNVYLQRGGATSRFVREALTGANRVIVVSCSLRFKAVACGVSSDWVTVIPNGISLDEASPRSGGKTEGAYTVIAVGNLVASKGYDFLLRGFAQVAAQHGDLRLVIIGRGVERDRLVRLADSLDVGTRTTFLGQVPREEVFRHLTNADAFVLPSWREGFGIAYLEAMAHGLPVVACRGEGPEDFVRDGVQGYLIAPRSVTAVAQAIHHLYQNPRQARDMGAAGRRLVQTQYSWKGVSSQILQTYNIALHQ